MKKIVFIILIFNSYHLFAQDCIPDPSGYSRELIGKLTYKTTDSLHNMIITWKDIEPLYDSILQQDKKDTLNVDKVPVRDSAQYEIEVKLVNDLNTNIDSLLIRGSRFGINWHTVNFKVDASKIAREKDLPANLWFNDGKIYFTGGDSTYEIGYKAMLVKGNWKLVDIGTRISVFGKDGTQLGAITSYYDDYSNPATDSTQMIMDSTIAAQSKMAGKKPVKHTPKKHVVSPIKTALIKQDQ